MSSSSPEGTPQELQLFLNGLDGRTKIINIYHDASIEDLFQKIHDVTRIPVEEIRLIYTTRELRTTDHKGVKQYLKDYRIENNGSLTLVLRLRGGSAIIKVLGSDIELSDAPDMITLDDDCPRAKMPCGHTIGPESLTDYCRSQLNELKFEFRCPYPDPRCGQLWEFSTIKRYAVLTQEEQMEFEKKIAENYIRKNIQIQDCPKCSSFCYRNNTSQRQVICPSCSQRNGRDYAFCWFCLKPWQTRNYEDCGNYGCSTNDPLRILQECSKKVVVGVPNFPSVRACPQCGRLIEHKEACKHMECPCKQRFCFICLKKADTDGNYQCGSYNSKCDVAPVQTVLPRN